MRTGHGLLRLAEIVCGPQARHTVFEPLIADLDREWRDAGNGARLRLALAGGLAFVRSLLSCVDATHAMASAPVTMWWAVLLLFGFGGAAIALQPLHYTWIGVGIRFLWLPAPPNLFLLPNAVAHTLAFALLPAMLIATCAGWSRRRRIAATGAAIAVVVIIDGWIAPLAAWHGRSPAMVRLSERLQRSRADNIGAYATIPEVIAATRSLDSRRSREAWAELRRKGDVLVMLLAFAGVGTALGRARAAARSRPRVAVLVGWWLFAWVAYRALGYWGDFLLAMIGLPPAWQDWVAPTIFIALSAAAIAAAARTAPPRAAGEA